MKKSECDLKPNIERQLALTDAIELLGGKWRISILRSLYRSGSLRFKDLALVSGGVTPKVLSRELQQLEENMLVSRTVNNTRPVTVSYALTNYAIETLPVIKALVEFGLQHRANIKSRV